MACHVSRVRRNTTPDPTGLHRNSPNPAGPQRTLPDPTGTPAGSSGPYRTPPEPLRTPPNLTATCPTPLVTPGGVPMSFSSSASYRAKAVFLLRQA